MMKKELLLLIGCFASTYANSIKWDNIYTLEEVYRKKAFEWNQAHNDTREELKKGFLHFVYKIHNNAHWNGDEEFFKLAQSALPVIEKIKDNKIVPRNLSSKTSRTITREILPYEKRAFCRTSGISD